ncbi:MAG: DNA repair protein RecO [Armatimonadetes bacterium]|nr:DNA repair protein RecO [Armatimonadota bacterium]
MPVYKAEAIVIRRVNLGEADRLVTLYARDHGKIAAVAKGARKPKSRFAGRLELFTHIRALLAVGKSLDVVSQIEVIEPFAPLRSDLTRLGYASFVAELMDRATADREPAPEIFRALRAALTFIMEGDAEMGGLWFAARILALIGYAPVVGRCAVCGRPVSGTAVYSYALGGTLCETDRPRDPLAATVSAAALKSVGFLLETRPDTLARLSLDRRLRTEVEGLLLRSLEYRLETKLKSPLVIQKLRQRDNATTR